MKFLQHDSTVVALRFKYQIGSPEGVPEAVSEENELTFDTVGEIQDAMAELFPNGDMPFSLQEDILDLDAFRTEGDYTQSDLISRLAPFQNNLNAALAERGEFLDISNFMQALQEFMNARAIDLSGFSKERSGLMSEIAQIEDHAEAGAEAALDRMALVGDITDEGLAKDAERTEDGKQTPDHPVASFASKVEDLPQVVSQAGPTIENIMAEMAETTIGGFDNFNTAQVA